MEIKGLGASFARAKGLIGVVREATAQFEETVTPFLSDLSDVTKQVAAMHSDLKFEAETLGNGASSTVSVKPSPDIAKPVDSQPSESAQLAETK